MMCVFLLISFLLPTLGHAAQIYHVQQSAGSDSYTCEQAKQKVTARRSINAGLACLAGGDELHIADGTYDELVVGQVDGTTQCQSNLAAIQSPCAALPNGPSPEQPTRVIAPGGAAIVSPRGKQFPGGGGIITLFSTSRNLYFEGLRLVTDTASGSASGFLGGDAQHITWTRGELDNGTMKSSPGSQYFTVTHTHIHHAGRGCDQSQDPYPFCAHGVYQCGQNHIFTDNIVEYSAYYNVQFSCEGGGLANIRIERNTVRYAYGVGIRCGGENCTIASNLLVGNGTAITMSGSGVVAHNTIDSYTQGKGDPWGIYLTWGDWSTWQVVDNMLTRQKSSFYAIGDHAFRAPDLSRVHHNLCSESGNAGCTLQGSASAVYTNADLGDYTLRRARDNPALGAGVPVEGVSTDLRGRPFHGEHPSLGAYALTPDTPPEPIPPVPPSGPLVLACTGTVQAVPGVVTMQCTQPAEGRR